MKEELKRQLQEQLRDAFDKFDNHQNRKGTRGDTVEVKTENTNHYNIGSKVWGSKIWISSS